MVVVFHSVIIFSNGDNSEIFCYSLLSRHQLQSAVIGRNHVV